MRPAWPVAAAAALLTVGCGQKGPLYLPDKNAKVVTTPAAPPASAVPAAPPAPKPRPNGQDPDSPQPQPPQ